LPASTSALKRTKWWEYAAETLIPSSCRINLFEDVAKASLAPGMAPRNTSMQVSYRHITLDDAEIAANRSSASNDPKTDAAVRCAAKLASVSLMMPLEG
jgi:hypothetical protein